MNCFRRPGPTRGVCALALVALFARGLIADEGSFYASNAMGVVRDAIAADEIDAHEWIIRVDASAVGETHVLFRDGVEIERTDFVVVDGVLAERRVGLPDGTIRYTERYSYWADGSLRSVVHDGSGDTITYRYEAGRMVLEWHDTGRSIEESRFDRAGRLVLRRVRVSDAILEQEERDYWADGAGSPLRSVTRTRDGEVTVEQYNERGVLVGVTSRAAEAVRSALVRVFDGDLLVEERSETDAGLLVRRFFYEAGVLIAERVFRDGALTLVVDHEPGADYTRTETIHRGDEALLRVYFRGQVRIRESVLRDGEAIRTREFATPDGQS
ncbi:MAG: hypothetical protein EA382_13540 [Spirochaetaceae bacterium]|nr:MAG: hypothetical protein EA382_13540 [Spirochaetaceae bacterium]